MRGVAAMGASRMQAGFFTGVARACSLAAAVVASAVLWTAPAMAQVPTNIVSLDSDLLPYLLRFELPAVAAAVVKNGKIVAAGAVGTRRIGTETPLTVNDRFHIGSDTKAMTALLAAMLIEHPRPATGSNSTGTRPSARSIPSCSTRWQPA